MIITKHQIQVTGTDRDTIETVEDTLRKHNVALDRKNFIAGDADSVAGFVYTFEATRREFTLVTSELKRFGYEVETRYTGK